MRWTGNDDDEGGDGGGERTCPEDLDELEGGFGGLKSLAGSLGLE